MKGLNLVPKGRKRRNFESLNPTPELIANYLVGSSVVIALLILGAVLLDRFTLGKFPATWGAGALGILITAMIGTPVIFYFNGPTTSI